jgi:CDP-diacylglycerol--glycerol-3-phosphate 3-phosphatidyltransferase
MTPIVREELFNLPNMLTLARIAAIPVVMAFIWGGEPEDCVIAAWLYSAATLTDFFDGWLARRRGLVTVMGKFLDPLADKLIVMAMLVMLIPLHRVGASLVILILSREITVTGLRAVASIEGLVIPAGEDGKAKTALQMLGVMSVGELAARTEAELMGVKNFGQNSLDEIKRKLVDLGLSLRELD